MKTTTTQLKATELRIGNWVNYYNDDTCFRITEINQTGISVENKDEATWIELDQFSGIPLTPELLEKCGFEKEAYYDGNVFYIKLPDIYFYIEERDGNNYTVVSNADYPEYVKCSIPFKYVHQLQNIYSSLTGEDLTITL